MKGKHRLRRSIFAKLTLLLLSLGISVFIVEYTLPLLNVRSIEEAVYQARRPVVFGLYGAYHPQLSFTLQKNLQNKRVRYEDKLDYTFSTNQEGFRGPNWDPSDQRKNIFLLGDSFGFGWGVNWDQTVGTIVEKALRQIDPSYQVINLCMAGWALDFITAGFEQYVEKYKPQAVIYVFCPNDLLGELRKKPSGEYQLAYQPQPGDEQRFTEFLARQQPDYWSFYKYYRQSYGKAYHARVIRPIFSQRIYRSLAVDPAPAGFDFPPPLTPPVSYSCTDESRKFLYYCLDRIHAGLGQGPMFIIDTSDKSLLFKTDKPDNRRWLLHEYSAQSPRTIFIDFETHMRLTPGSRAFFLDYDDHWSASGHAEAARLLMEAIQKWHSGVVAGQNLESLQQTPRREPHFASG